MIHDRQPLLGIRIPDTRNLDYKNAVISSRIKPLDLRFPHPRGTIPDLRILAFEDKSRMPSCVTFVVDARQCAPLGMWPAQPLKCRHERDLSGRTFSLRAAHSQSPACTQDRSEE